MDYYCTSKFTDLMVHVQSRLLYNCCKAYPERIDLDWLEANPGRLSHTPTMLRDRQLMLENKSCASCHHGCYKYEEQGLLSTRMQNKDTDRIIDPYSSMQDLTISLSTDCNLACVYCSPEWSSAWKREIEKDGEYNLDQTIIKNDSWSKLWSKMKQNSRGIDGRFFSLLINEIKLAKDIKSITLIGGEPLINNGLEQVIDSAKHKEINIITGLGVSHERLKKILKNTKGLNIKFKISAETTGKFFEFIRHGLRWKDFKQRVEMIHSHNHKIEFISTISNISVFDLHNFYQCYSDRYPININIMSERPFLQPHVLDESSKTQFLDRINMFGTHGDRLVKMISPNSDTIDRDNIKKYLTMLSHRRKIDLNFLPKHFLNWCGIQ